MSDKRSFMHFINRLSAVLIICLFTTHSFPQVNYQPQKIAPAALKNDFILMKDSLQKIHAGLYNYKSKSAIDNIFDSCYHSINDSMSVTDFYALTSFVIASIEDGHTSCQLSRDCMNNYVNNAKVFFCHGFVYSQQGLYSLQ